MNIALERNLTQILTIDLSISLMYTEFAYGDSNDNINKMNANYVKHSFAIGVFVFLKKINA